MGTGHAQTAGQPGASAAPGAGAVAPAARPALTRRAFLSGALSVAAAAVIITDSRQAPAWAASGPLLNFVAHEDDDLLFLSPYLLNAIHAGSNVRTVFLTAGDDGNGASYWQIRQSGSKAAYANMAGVANSWKQTDAGVPGHPMPLYTLANKPSVSLVFMHLPDGNVDGSGYSYTGNESLQKLWMGSISSITAVDGSSSYTKATLTSVLTSFMTAFKAGRVSTQDYAGSYGDGDHSDHHSAAYFTQAAQQQYTTAHTFTGYLDYITDSLAANVSGATLTAKQNAFYAYGKYDTLVCDSQSTCAGSNYEAWLERQYTVGAIKPVANAGADQTVQVNAAVQLNGTASYDPDGDPLTYQWTQTSGTAVTLSSTTVASPTFTAPASPATLTFQLVVSDGQTSSNPAAVTITVTSTAGSTDLALAATATASSQNTSTGQTAAKAIDGVIDGYPGDYTREWATVGGGAGSWLKLTWTSAQTINTLVLYDRPNLNDQITGGNIAFSDGTTVAVGTLPNDGSAYTLTFTAKTVTSLQLNITAVSATTANIGLAEIQAYNTA